MTQELEHLFCEERLRKLELFSLEKKRLLYRSLPVPKGVLELERDFLQGRVVTGQGRVASN